MQNFLVKIYLANREGAMYVWIPFLFQKKGFYKLKIKSRIHNLYDGCQQGIGISELQQ